MNVSTLAPPNPPEPKQPKSLNTTLYVYVYEYAYVPNSQ